MLKVMLMVVIVGVVSKAFGDNEPETIVPEKVADGGRQKRLLFYDEEGNLVKTFTNPFLRNFLNPEKPTAYNSLLNPFLSLFRPHHYSAPMHFVVPVSYDVIQALNKDPSYQHQLFYLPARDTTVTANPLCNDKRTQIPSPSNCNEFLNCWDGWAFEQECPAGLLFSNQGYCDYPEKVNCFERQIEKEAQPRCAKEFEVFRSEAACGEFFVCVNQLPVKFKCPADLAYSQELGICDYPQRVDCKAFPTTAISIPASTQAATTVGDKKPDTSTVIAGKVTTAQPQPPAQDTAQKTVWSNSIYNSESWSSTHVAMSRQDAIRQLELRQLANVKAGF